MVESKWQKVIYDVEVYPNCFLCAIQDVDSKEKIVWEISDRTNEYDDIVKFFNGFNQYLISFNGIHYDNCIMMYIIHNKLDNVDNYLQKLKEWSDFIIHNDFWWNDKELSKYKYHNKWIDIDLFLYWSKMLRLSKKISLKGLAIQMNYPVVQELPFDPAMSLNHAQIDELRHYNSVHDLGITDLLFTQFTGKGTVPLGNLGTVQLRATVKQKYGINAFSFDAPKIASEVMIYKYCEKTNQDLRTFKKQRFEKTPFQFKDLFTDYKFEFKTKILKDIYNKWMNSHNTFNETFTCFTKNQKEGIKLSIGVGGIHNIVKNEMYEADSEYEICDIDIESLYPTFILGLHCFRFKELEETYEEFKHLRVTESKPNIKKFKGTDKEQFWKEEDAFNKVILNGLSGHIDQEYSPLYNNIGAMKMRCMGQLVLLTIIEKIHEENIKIIQVNTDGLTVLLPKIKKDLFVSIVQETEQLYKVKFEYGYYQKMILANVNNYLAQDLSGSIKQKGMFVEKPELGNSVDYLIIPKALKAFYIDNIPVKQFVESHNNILDFCCSQKVDKSYHIMWTNPQFVTSKQQRLNRFYASTKGGYIFKCRDNTQGHLLKESGVMIYNNHNPDVFPNDVNYKFYIAEINKIINQINRNNQISLF